MNLDRKMKDFKFGWLMVFMILTIQCGDKKSEQNLPQKEETKTQDLNQDNSKKTILFYGNSLTAGMGLDPNLAFPALIQQRIDSLGFDYLVVNSGLSGETTASGKNRLAWVLKQKVDIFVLELGANDGLRGIPLSETKKNLQLIIDQVKKSNPNVKIILAGMLIPPNMGPEYTDEFKDIFPKLASDNELLLIPFILDGVAGDPELNQEDGIHPTADGHRLVAENVWEVLKAIL